MITDSAVYAWSKRQMHRITTTAHDDMYADNSLLAQRLAVAGTRSVMVTHYLHQSGDRTTKIAVFGKVPGRTSARYTDLCKVIFLESYPVWLSEDDCQALLFHSRAMGAKPVSA